MCEDLTLTVTLHLMQAPHLVPRFVPLMPLFDTLRDTQCEPPAPRRSSLAYSKMALNQEMKNRFSSLLTKRSQQTTPESSEFGEPSMRMSKTRTESVFRSGSGSGSSSEMSNSLWTPRSGSRLGIDPPSTISSMSSLSSATQGLFSRWKRGLQSKHKKRQAIPQPPTLSAMRRDIEIMPLFQLRRSPQGMQYQTNARTTHSHATLPKLSLAQLRESEAALELLRRYINFDDEFCIARTGISFETIRPSCENQVVTVEFHVVNNWIDRTDYSRSTEFKRIIRNRHTDSGDDDPCRRKISNSRTEPIVAKVVTALCFVPGPEMDPESAIYGDEDYIHTEPQSLADCQVGLTYFRWRETTIFQGYLFYLTETNQWKEAWFCIVGSRLWQCHRTPIASSPSLSSLPPVCSTDIDALEKLRYLDLESVRFIEAGTQVYRATAQHLDGDEGLNFNHDMDKLSLEGFEEYSPVKHSFRLQMHVLEQRTDSDGIVPISAWKTVTQDFYTGSEDLRQAWVQSLRIACRDRPPRPYWLRKGE